MMMFRRVLGAMVCAAFAMPSAGIAAPAKAPTQITVSGQGTASAMPDMATESFTISTNAQSAAQATSDNNARYERLLSGLEALGIEHGDIRTTSYNVSYTPPPDPQPAGVTPPVRERSGYFVYRGVTVTLHRLPLVGKAIDSAIAAGVTDIGGVAFGISDRKGQQSLALRAAVRDAQAQAQAMAAAAGLHIVRVRFMQQGFASAPVPMVKMASAAAPSPPTQIEPGSVETQATVTVTYDAQ